MTNASNILNSGGNPGIIGTMTSAGTTSYTALADIQVTLNISVSTSGQSVTVNGVTVATSTGTGFQSYTIQFILQKGQTAVIVNVGSNTQTLASARNL